MSPQVQAKGNEMKTPVMVGAGVPYNHYCRVTGYCAEKGRLNCAKQAEVDQRVKHM